MIYKEPRQHLFRFISIFISHTINLLGPCQLHVQSTAMLLESTSLGGAPPASSRSKQLVGLMTQSPSQTYQLCQLGDFNDGKNEVPLLYLNTLDQAIEQQVSLKE